MRDASSDAKKASHVATAAPIRLPPPMMSATVSFNPFMSLGAFCE